MAQVGNKGAFKEFCSQDCVSNYEAKRTDKPKNEGVIKKCSVCDKMGQVKHEVNFQGQVHKLCSDACFAAFRYAHNLSMNCCDQCGVNCYNDKYTPQYMQYEGKPKRFCTLRCMNKFKDLHKRFVECYWCKTKKTNFEMVERVDSNNKVQLFCSLPCLQAYREKVSTQKSSASVTASAAQCHHCKKMSPPLFHLTMSDNTIRNFCCYNCVIAFQAQFNTPTVTLPHQTLQLQCSLCKMNFSSKPVTLEYKGNCTQFCSQPCLEDFKRINAITAVCDMCQQEKILYETCKFSGQERSFCSEGCKLLFKQDFTKGLGLKCIVCDYCSQLGKALCDKVIDGKKKQFCSLACLDKYELWYSQAARCDGCRQQGRRLEESFMWRGEMKHVCNQHCLLLFYTQQNVPNLTTQMQPKLPDSNHVTSLNTLAGSSSTPIIASVMSLAPGQQQNQVVFQQPVVSTINKVTTVPTILNKGHVAKPSQIKIQNIQGSATKLHPVTLPTVQSSSLLKTNTDPMMKTVSSQVMPPLPKLDPPPPPPAPPKILKNKSLMCKPFTQTKATSCKPHQSSKSTSTEADWKPKLIVVPIPVPIYVPVPMQMYNSVVPAPVFTPMPLPVPMWLPVANNDADKLIKTMEEIKEKTPSDPLEAELLLMAEAIAGEKSSSDSKKEEDNLSASGETQEDGETGNLTFEETEQVIPSQMLEDDILQMAANIAQVISEPSNDQDFSAAFHNSLETPDLATIDFEEELLSPREQRARARAKTAPTTRSNTRSSKRRGRGRKKTKVIEEEDDDDVDTASPATPQQQNTSQSQGFKYTYGINAYRIWAQQKNQESNSEDSKKIYKFKSDILQCSADEINYSLFHFLKEVRKPSGDEYTPDTIFYLCLGIQQYLFENGRVENVFTDIYFEKFTDILTEILSHWKPDINHIGMINTCIEEEMLWECKQLGAHSPFVLLGTLVYFNTKYFNLKTSEQHCKMSFTHVLKHWKKSNTKNQTKSVYLRYYNPQIKGQEPGNKRKRDDAPMLEQAENTDNPLRCPVKLYEFYLSKCPESVRNKSDVFYLVPEKSCVPDSPVWYSGLPVGQPIMHKMLTRNIMVKEVHEQWESFALDDD
ncbi:zinc finger MYM-type protein 3-like [Glandiceps talaboti]